MIHLTLKRKDARVLNDGARELAIILRENLRNGVLGPEYPLIARVKNLYIKRILIKFERNENLNNNKEQILEMLDPFRSLPLYKSIRIQIDVDPV